MNIFLVSAMIAFSCSAHNLEAAEPNTKHAPKADTSHHDDKDALCFPLSKEAINTFEIATMKLKGKGSWSIPKDSVVYSGEEASLYQVVNTCYKKVEVNIVIKQAGGDVLVNSHHLTEGDVVVIKGSGFLRVVELDSLNGEVGHAH